jgi:uncharacterized protein
VTRVLVDAGPLIAILSPKDAFHHRCLRTAQELSPPLYTCWPVLTEVAWFLRADPAAIDRLFKSIAFGLYRFLPLDESDAVAIAGILRQYRSLKPQLADAAVVHLARREGIDTIFTLGRRDFQVYQKGVPVAA